MFPERFSGLKRKPSFVIRVIPHNDFIVGKKCNEFSK